MSKAKKPQKGHRAPLAGEDVGTFHACSRKRRFASKVDAQKAANAASKHKDVPRLYVYQCELCGGWHLTHRRPRK